MGGRRQRKSKGAPRFAQREAAVGSARIAGAISTPDERTYAYDDATVTLELPWHFTAQSGTAMNTESLSLQVPVGPVALDALVPTARALSSRVTLRVLASEEAQGRSVSCAKGCGDCCRQLVPVSSLEARMVARLVDAMEPGRRDRVRARFALVRDRLVEEGLLARDAPPGSVELRGRGNDPKAAWLDLSKRYFSLRIACPFLDDESCSIHETAPLVCREFHVSSPPERCKSLEGGAAEMPRPLRMSEVLSTAVAAAAGVSDKQVPLSLAVGWYEAHGEALEGGFDGEKLFEALMGAVAEAE